MFQQIKKHLDDLHKFGGAGDLTDDMIKERHLVVYIEKGKLDAGHHKALNKAAKLAEITFEIVQVAA